MNFLSTLTGCFAQPVAENPTVAMVEAAYRRHGLDARYLNCEVAPPTWATRYEERGRWDGSASTAPSRTRSPSSPTLDELAPSATIIGAVNCVVPARAD